MLRTCRSVNSKTYFLTNGFRSFLQIVIFVFKLIFDPHDKFKITRVQIRGHIFKLQAINTVKCTLP